MQSTAAGKNAASRQEQTSGKNDVSKMPYYTYKAFLAKKFESRLQKVSVNAGFTCPNRDGSKAYGGCTYCNNVSFVPSYCKPGMSIAEQVAAGIDYVERRYKANHFLVYFQAYTNTYGPLPYLKVLFQQALAHPQVRGLAIGTRPDCIDEEKLDYLQQLAADNFISLEYGLESISDATLKRINRAQTFAEWEAAVALTAGRNIDICTHVILGLPGETRDHMLQTAEVISRYPIDSLKLHHLHIVKKTILAQQYLKQPFPTLGYEEYVDLVIEFLRRLRPTIAIQRLVGETQPRHLLAPNWNARAYDVQRMIEKEMRQRGVWQGELYKA